MIGRGALSKEQTRIVLIVVGALAVMLLAAVAAALGGSQVSRTDAVEDYEMSVEKVGRSAAVPFASAVRTEYLDIRTKVNFADDRQSLLEDLGLEDVAGSEQSEVSGDVGSNAVSLEELDPSQQQPAEQPAEQPVDATAQANELLAVPAQPDSIMGRTMTTVDALVAEFEAHGQPYPDIYASYGAPTLRDFCQQCIEESVAEGVRAEVLFAQSMHETGWLQFGGQVSPEQCNFGGLGATNDGAAGASFPDVRTGLRAQVQHLKAYASTDSLNQGLVDERFDLVSRGSAPTVQDLGGKWAVPGDTYGDALMAIVNRIVA